MALKMMVYLLLSMAAAVSTALPCRCKLMPFEKGSIADCSNKDLTEVPSCVLNDTTVLEFSGNNVSAVNSRLTSQKPALRQLIVCRSHVTGVAVDAFSLTPELRRVELSHNAIHELPAGLFDASPLLEVVDLSANMLRDLPMGLFKNVPHLTRLDLSNNYLSTLPGDLLAGCGKQAILRVASNHLTTLPASLISSCSSLAELDASSNQMTVFREDVMVAIAQLSELNILLLRGNPWQCDCTLSPLAELLRTHDSLDEELTCGAPPALRQLHVVHAVSQLDCLPSNVTIATSRPPVRAAHAADRGHRSAPPATNTVTIVVVAAVATCCTLAAVGAFFINRHRKRKPVDRFSLLLTENS